MAKEVSFEVSARDRALIRKIVKRAVSLVEAHGQKLDPLSCSMDVTATHANGNPLRLRDLLDADDFNFAHDVLGIERHLNRRTGKLGNHFSPRFSVPASQAKRRLASLPSQSVEAV